MSAFICDTDNFSRIYKGLEVYNQDICPNAAKRIECLKVGFGDLPEIIQKLYGLNVRAVKQKYGEERISDSEEMDPRELMEIRKSKGVPTACQFLKSLECLRYQMSEGTVPYEMLYREIERLIKALQMDKVQDTKEYKTAVWG